MVIFGATIAGADLAEDMKGIIDRFRSLPLAPSAVLTRRTLSDVVNNVLVLVVMNSHRAARRLESTGSVAEAALGVPAAAGVRLRDLVGDGVARHARPERRGVQQRDVHRLPLTFVANTFIAWLPALPALQTFAGGTRSRRWHGVSRELIGNIPAGPAARRVAYKRRVSTRSSGRGSSCSCSSARRPAVPPVDRPLRTRDAARPCVRAEARVRAMRSGRSGRCGQAITSDRVDRDERRPLPCPCGGRRRDTGDRRQSRLCSRPASTASTASSRRHPTRAPSPPPRRPAGSGRRRHRRQVPRETRRSARRPCSGERNST